MQGYFMLLLWSILLTFVRNVTYFYIIKIQCIDIEFKRTFPNYLRRVTELKVHDFLYYTYLLKIIELNYKIYNEKISCDFLILQSISKIFSFKLKRNEQRNNKMFIFLINSS